MDNPPEIVPVSTDGVPQALISTPLASRDDEKSNRRPNRARGDRNLNSTGPSAALASHCQLNRLQTRARTKDGLRRRRKNGGSGVSRRLQKQWQLHRVQHPHHSIPDVMRDHTLNVVLTQEPGYASVVLG